MFHIWKFTTVGVDIWTYSIKIVFLVDLERKKRNHNSWYIHTNVCKDSYSFLTNFKVYKRFWYNITLGSVSVVSKLFLLMWFQILLKTKTKFTESSALGDGFIKTRYIPTTHMKPLFGQAKPPPKPIPIFHCVCCMYVRKMLIWIRN